MKKLLTLAIAAACCFTSHAQDLEIDTGSKLIAACSVTNEQAEHNSLDSVRQGMCFGYVTALRDSEGMRIAAHLPGDTQLHQDFCLPEGVSLGQMMLVIKKYGNDNPRFLHLQTIIFARAALHESFPCEASRKTP